MTDDHVLIEADREVRAALLLAGADDGSATNGRYNLVLTLAELRVVHTAIAAQLAERHDEPDVLSKTTFWPETPDEILPEARPQTKNVWTHSIYVRETAAIPGVQALLFLYLAVDDVQVSKAFEGWQLTWRSNEAGKPDLDFLRPHILP